MRKIILNALSVTNHSGGHVLRGHGTHAIRSLADSCRFVVLCHASATSLKEAWGGSVDWIHAPERTRHWLPRWVWESRHLPRLARDPDVAAYFTPSGVAAPGVSVPQVVFCQNPWALVRSARRLRDAPKAALQRWAYRQTVRRADILVFNSRFMRDAYRANAGCREREGHVIYQAPDDETHQAAVTFRNTPRESGRIVCVSVMGPHKNIETIVRAVEELRRRGRGGVSLHLVGGWPDRAYERHVRSEIRRAALDDAVHLHGHVARTELYRHYAEARVFCLMSRCESFGIPAIEAQCFGTPVVCSNVCAVPEICGDGGLFCDPGDVAGVARHLDRLLADETAWQAASSHARVHAGQFTWARCSPALTGLLRKQVTPA